MINGIVSNVMKEGFGFIEVEGYDKNVFFHASECAGIKIEQLRKGDKVSIREVIETEKGFSGVKIALLEE